MTPTGKLPLQDWMTDPRTRAVMAALTAAGMPARFVGGCVRNAILARSVGDIDIATPAEPAQVMALLAGARIKAIPTGIDHGTVTAISDGKPFEITTLRKDVETMGRHARVAFTDDWVADAERRDFTMNALYADADGTLYDPTGGLADLQAGRVRFVGDPARRISEDYLRILRFFRIYAHYGTPPADVAALAACRAHAAGLRTLSAERIAQEFLKLLAAADPATVMRLMREVGVLDVVLPEATHVERLAALTGIDDGDPLRRLAAVLALPAEQVPAVAERLRLSLRDRDRLQRAAGSDVVIDVDRRTARALLYRLGPESFVDQAYLRAAERGQSPAALLQLARDWQPPAFSLRGDDVLALGVEKGPAIGRLLRAVEEWWLERDFAPGRDELLAELRRAAGR